MSWLAQIGLFVMLGLLAVDSGLVERVQNRLTLINEHGPLARWVASGRNRRRLLDGN